MSDNDSSPNDSQAPSDDIFSPTEVAARAKIWDDFLAKQAKKPPRKPAPPSQPTTPFDQDFFQVAGPKLLNLITALAPMVQVDVYSFSEAWCAVWQIAAKYGSAHLSETALHNLDDWISREILARVDDKLPADFITPERLAQITGEPR